jgi:hypothetical protein
MKKRHNENRINTTLGELIAAISDVAFENGADTKDAYHLTRLVLNEMLKGSTFGGEITNPPPFWN